MSRVPRRRPSPLALAAVAVLLAVSGCAAGGGADSDSSSGGEDGFRQSEPAAESAPDADDALSVNGARSGPDPAVTDRKLIAKGSVSLESDDVEATLDDVEGVVDDYGGEVSERETRTDDDGALRTARLLLRIPVADFTAALADLEQVADLESSTSGSEDVTTEVIDTRVRIRAQRRSLLRVEELLDRAQSIGDIIRIEGQLTRRQADLDSLEQRLDYLENQTSMSTITVTVSVPPRERVEDDEPEETGFAAGLDDGWEALKSFGTALATLTGRMLPFATVLLLLGAPLLLVVRRLRRRDRPAVAAPPSL